MKRLIVIILLAMVTAVMASDNGNARLEIGVRSTYFELHDSTRGPNEHYMGSLDELIEEQDYLPLPFINVRFGRYLALGLGYDQFRVKTWSRPEPGDGEIGHSDGTLDTAGPTISLQCYIPNRTRYTPFVEAGLLIYNTYFDHLPAWRDARGEVNSHVLEIHDENGYRLSLGCDISLTENSSLLVTVEHTSMKVDATYFLNGRLADTTTFPLDNTRYGVGLKYHL